MRLIDADEVVKAVHDEFDECLVWDESGATTANEFENIILQIPTVDVDSLNAKHEDIGYEKGFRDGYAEALEETDNVPDKNVGKRLIDADAFFNDFPELKNYEHASQEYEVDAEPVVRCKDCKKYIPCQKLPIGTSKWCDMFDRATCEMNYCGWGERREDET